MHHFKANRVYGFFARHPVFLITLALGSIGLVTALGAKKAHIDSTVESVMLEHDPEKERFDKLLERFGSDEVLAVAIQHDDLFSQATTDMTMELVRHIEGMSGVNQVKSLYTAKSIRANGDDLEVTKLLPSAGDDAEKRKQYLEQAQVDRLFQKNLISLDGKTSGVIVFFRHDATEAQKEAVSLYALDFAHAHKGPEKLWVSGSPAIKVQMSQLVRRSFAIVIGPAVLVCGILAGLIMQSYQALFTTVLIGLLSLLGTIMTWFALGHTINPFTAVSPLVLLVIALAYSVHTTARFREERDELARQKRTDRRFYTVISRRTYRGLMRPLYYICLTTFVGFISQVTSVIPAVRDMGIILAMGIPVTFIVCTFFGIPFLQLTRAFKEPSFRRESPDRRAPFTRLLADISHDRGHVVFFVTVVCCLISAWGVSQLRVQSNTFDWFPDDAEARKAEDAIQANLMSTSTINLYVMTERPDAAVEPEFLRKAEALQNVLLRDPLVDGVTSLVDYVKQLNESANKGNYSAYRIPGDKNLIKQYFFVLSDPDSIERLTDQKYTSLRFFIRAKTRDSVGLRDLRARMLTQANAIFAGDGVKTEAGSTLYFLGAGFDLISNDMATSMFSTFIVTFLIISWMLRSFSKALVTMVPNVLPIFFAYGLMGLWGYKLDYAISTVAASLLGIAVDDSIHFTQTFESYVAKGIRWRRVIGQTFRHTGMAVMMTTVIMCSGLAIFSFAQSKWMIAFGTAMTAGLFAGLLCDLFMLAPMLQRYYEKRTKKLPHDIFYDVLLPAERDALRNMATKVSFKPGEPVVNLERNLENVLFLTKGSVAITYLQERRNVPTVVKVSAPDCLNEFHPDVGAFTYYQATAETEVEALSVPSYLIADLCGENSHAYLLMRSLFHFRARTSADRSLIHNSRIFSRPWFYISTALQGILHVMIKHVFLRLLRARCEWPKDLALSRISGNIVVVSNHHYEFDAALTGNAVSDLGIISPHRSPFFLANGNFWLSNVFTRAISMIARLVIIQRGSGKQTQQYGFQYVRNLFKPYEEATVFVFPWACTPVGTVNASGKKTFSWILENLDCTIVPVCMIGMSRNPVRALLGSIFKPLKWRVGIPVNSKELLKQHGSAETAELAVAQSIVLMSEGTLKLATTDDKTVHTEKRRAA